MMQRGHKGDNIWRSPSKNGKRCLNIILARVTPKLPLFGVEGVSQRRRRHLDTPYSREWLLPSFCMRKSTILENTLPFGGDRVLGYRVHQAVIQAVKKGNVEFVTRMIKSIPELVWNGDINDRNIFSIAILNRQEKIFNLLHGLTNVNKMKVTSDDDRFGNNMLHLAAMLAPSDQLDGISGAALQMQRELQWFKEVESIVPPICKDVLNSDGKKPSEVFSQQHANLPLLFPGVTMTKALPYSWTILVHGFYNIGFNLTLFCYYFSVDVPGNPDITICRKQIAHAVAHKADNWPFDPFHLYCSHDDSLLCCPCYFTKEKLNQSGYDPDYFTCLCSGDPICIIAISPSC
ncbi:hypothetical protein CK203_044144 [Vitis vinifera]|uniref:Uncharacterized protein n=1 Tax=Vitis vinifera TaxID=29760 RepID=A0A438I2R3_VITVI|nr:hypothetical protein CK203_044144 [Vitis vinifera]